MIHQPLVSIIVPAYNEERCLPTALEAIHSAARALGIDYEIVVADDDSTDATSALARRAGARVVTVANRQISKTRNDGARAATGDRLVFVDALTGTLPSFLSTHPADDERIANLARAAEGWQPERTPLAPLAVPGD